MWSRMIYKIFRAEEWALLEREHVTHGAPVDLADGFIHFSTAEQVAGTAARHFAGCDGLWLAAIDEARLGDALKWEVSRGGALFPHLYRPLKRAEVDWCVRIPLTDKGHVLPDDLA